MCYEVHFSGYNLAFQPLALCAGYHLQKFNMFLGKFDLYAKIKKTKKSKTRADYDVGNKKINIALRLGGEGKRDNNAAKDRQRYTIYYYQPLFFPLI
jgi:hypothetical protein